MCREAISRGGETGWMEHVAFRRVRLSVTVLALIPLSFDLTIDDHDLQN